MTVPCFKNRKLICGNRLITDPKIKARKERIEQAIYYQLLSMCQTGGSGTTLECSKQSVIASLPQDDDWRDIEIGSVKTIKVDKGQEGFEIEIEKL